MIELVNSSSEKTSNFNQQAAGVENEGNSSQKLASKEIVRQKKKGVYFQASKQTSANWKDKGALYNSQGKKTNNIFTADHSKAPSLNMRIPVSGQATISSDYGADRGSYTHKGMDFDGQMGDEISSTATGKVIFAGKTKTGGKEIAIQHAGQVITRYSHLNKINVKEGEFVKKGQQVGTMGNTGETHTDDDGNGSHLHFEVLKNGENVDPDKYLNLRGAEHEKGDYGRLGRWSNIGGNESAGEEKSTSDTSSNPTNESEHHFEYKMDELGKSVVKGGALLAGGLGTVYGGAGALVGSFTGGAFGALNYTKDQAMKAFFQEVTETDYMNNNQPRNPYGGKDSVYSSDSSNEPKNPYNDSLDSTSSSNSELRNPYDDSSSSSSSSSSNSDSSSSSRNPYA